MAIPSGIEIPPEPELPYRAWTPALEHHATAVGYVCMAYANLEDDINRLLQIFLNCSNEQRRAIVDATGTTISNRCALLLKLASIATPSQGWFDDLEWLANRVTEELAPERNRLIHDVWVQGPTDAYQWDQRSFLKSPQSHQPKKITPVVDRDRSLPIIWDLHRRINEVLGWITYLTFNFAAWLQDPQKELERLPDDVRKRTDPAARPDTNPVPPPPPPPSGA